MANSNPNTNLSLGSAVDIAYVCMLLSFAVDLSLWGLAMLLVGQYFRQYRDDNKISAAVLTLTALSTIHIFTFLCWMYADLMNVVRFADCSVLADKHQMSNTTQLESIQLLAVYLVAFTSQCFFATRIWILSKRSVVLTAPIAVLALLQIVTGIIQCSPGIVVGAVRGVILGSTFALLQSGATLVCDVTITLILCFVLHRSRTGNGRIDGILDRLILFAINRGTITSLAAALTMLLIILPMCAVSSVSSEAFIIPLLPSCQLYVIGVVATLMGRKSRRIKSSNPDTESSQSFVSGQWSTHSTQVLITKDEFKTISTDKRKDSLRGESF